jgi:hypothetical protein
VTPDTAVGMTTVIWGVAAVASLVVAVPQAVLLVRTSLHRDPLWWFRLKTTLLFGSLGIAMLRNVAVWADLAYFDQRYLGPIAVRWPFDLGLSLAICSACVLAAVLYVQTQHEVRP